VRQMMSVAIALLFAAGPIHMAFAQTSGTVAAPEKKADMKKAPLRNVSGTVKSSSADNVVVAGRDKGRDAEWTFGVEPTTNIRKGGKSITAGDLKSGDAVNVKFMEQGGKAMAQSILVKAARKDAKKAEK
jgi:hypothetical protein